MKSTGAVGRGIYLLLGFGLLALGFLGAFLPVLPTTIFLILAAGCFARSSPRIEAWLLDHRRFGPTLRDWRENRAIRPGAKLAALAGMAAGYVLFLAGAQPGTGFAIIVGAVLIACAAYVATRPGGRSRSG